MKMNWYKSALASVSGGLFGLAMMASPAQAQLTSLQWDGGVGAGLNWHTATNWNPDVVPNGGIDHPTVSAAGNLSVTLGSTPALVAGLTIGGTSVATTQLTSGGAAGTLTFENSALAGGILEFPDFNGDRYVDGRDFLIWQRGLGSGTTRGAGDANGDFTVDAADLAILRAQFGKFFPAEEMAFLSSKGAAGSVNTISAPIHLNDTRLEIDANEVPLTINTGDFTASVTLGAGAPTNRTIAVTQGTTTIDSNIVITNSATGADNGGFGFNNVSNTSGTLIINGIRRSANPATPNIGSSYGTNTARVVLNGASELTGGVGITGLVTLGHNNAFGVSASDPNVMAAVTLGSNANLSSANDSIAIPNRVELTQNSTVSGDKILTLTGVLTQGNQRQLNNNMTGGGMLVIEGDLRIFEVETGSVTGTGYTGPTYDNRRRFTFGGNGTTKITGSISNSDQPGTLNGDPEGEPIVDIDGPRIDGVPGDRGRDIRLTGGVLILDMEAGDNDHRGDLQVEGGNAHFANNDSLNLGTHSMDANGTGNIGQGLWVVVPKASDTANLITATGGAVGVDTGSIGNTAFISRITPFDAFALTGSDGGFMIAAHEASTNIDFSSPAMANAAYMSLAAPETGLTYTGTITPNADGVYRLGGGNGTLTVPGAALTGLSNSLVAKNGGTVVLTGVNTYGGSTSIEANTTLSITNKFLADASNVLIAATGTLNLNFTGVADTIGALSFDGGTTFAAIGEWGAVGSGAVNTSARLTGTGRLNVTAAAFSAVPEPSTLALVGIAALGLRRRRKSA
jgi:fibronectin-binding autotransporter adhesin